MFHSLPRPSLGLNIIQALITINQNPGSHAREQPTKVKHQMHHSKKTGTESQPWQEEHPTTFSLQKMENIYPEAEDTLELESSSDSPLPEGLLTQH